MSHAADIVYLKISELLEVTQRLHGQALNREREEKAVLSAVSSFNSNAKSLSVKLEAFKADVHKQVTKPLSTNVDVIQADLKLIKVLLQISMFFLSYQGDHLCRKPEEFKNGQRRLRELNRSWVRFRKMSGKGLRCNLGETG